MKKNFLFIIVNFFVYIISFPITHLIYRQHFHFEQKYLNFFEIYLFSWLVSSVLARKFRQTENENYFLVARPYIISFFLMLGMITFLINYFEHRFSRVIVSGTLVTAFFIELMILGFSNFPKLNLQNFKGLVHSKITFIIELLSFSWILLFTLFVKMDLAKPVEYYIMLVFSTYIIWFSASIITHNFTSFNQSQNYFKALWNYFAADVLIISLVMFVLFLLNIKTENKITYITGMVIYSLWSLGIFLLRYLYNSPKSTDEVSPSLFKAPTLDFEYDGLYKEYFIAPSQKYEVNPTAPHDTTVREKLENIYLRSLPTIFTFIDKFICLKRVNILKSLVIRSADPYNIEVLPENSFDLLINLHEMNDIRRLNHYFIDINKRLVSGGVFIGVFEPVRFRHKRFHDKYPFILAKFLYFIDFIWRRVFPKLPVLKKIYFSLTKGRDRAISMAECFGRLYYCGFEIIETLVENNMLYFIVKKAKNPATDSNPSYGPLFKMKRIGKGGNPVYVYKFRTMHPYSEYLQKYVFERNSLQEGGKIKDDFRITYWGKIFRKLWIDELPMILNFIKGELKIVGVRPLSSHYLSLYTDVLREKRKLVKPGLVPPFYYDMPKTLDEIMQSEIRYIEAYLKNPILTDIRYFFKAFYNIVIKKARSG